MTTTTDTTMIGNGYSTHATESFAGPVPMEKVRELFDFQVEYKPLWVHSDDSRFNGTRLTNCQAIVRSDNGVFLNTVSKSHGLHQFSDVLIENLLKLIDASEDQLEVAGAGLLKNGAVGWVQVQAPSLLAGHGDVAPTLTLASSHDGSLATSYRMGMYRFICSNQIGALRGNSKNVFKLRHTANSSMNFSVARDTLGVMWKHSAEFNRDITQLIETSVINEEFDRIVNRLDPVLPSSATQSAQTRRKNRVETISRLYHEDDRVRSFNGTGWGVVQAFNTYGQHERPCRAKGNTGSVSRLGRTMNNYLSGAIALSDQKVVQAVLAEVSH